MSWSDFFGEDWSKRAFFSIYLGGLGGGGGEGNWISTDGGLGGAGADTCISTDGGLGADG